MESQNRELISKVIRQGSSFVITIPKQFVKTQGISSGDYVKKKIFGDTIELKVIHL